MKKLFVIISLIIFAHLIPKESNAQMIKVGGGAELRSQPPAALILKATYNMGFFDENLRSSVDLMVLPDFEGNLDFHYSFLNEFGVNGYGLAGMNFAKNLGANVGVGFMYNIQETLDAFGEVKYIIKNSPEASIKIGLLYSL
jgi:hypothetical protein